ncbi:MAG: DUF4860 domain-containing protein [Oscillospiraceae bacterium]|jgi:hypothetical protein|nr:DUF4860 domain-containing protein [Oscillospiraceae bacterium]
MKRYIHTADAVFALILFCAFAISMLMVLMTGAQAYQGVRDTVENHYSEDTCISYIAMKLRHYDDEGSSVYIGDIAGLPALYLSESFDGEEYVTAIYFYDGYVMELYAEKGYDFDPEHGFRIVAAREMTVSEPSDGLFRISCVGTGGARAETTLGLRGGGAS